MSERVLLPEVADDAATVCGWSDRFAATIISRTDKKIVVRTDDATLLNGPQSGEADALRVYPGGFAGHWEGTQRYAYETCETGSVMTFSLRKNGRWIQQGTKDGYRLIVGRRSSFYDYNF